MTETRPPSHGPLAGLRIVEFAGLGPTPFAAMTLADMGAEVVRIARPGAAPLIAQDADMLDRGRDVVELDLKAAPDLALARDLAASADGLIEGMRPGTMERLGLGPEPLIGANEKLVYGRMTGWGQDGPRARTAGHDINYIAVTGMLHAIGQDDPVVPLNLLGDFGGGGIYLAFGMVCALFEAQRSGRGQVVDAAITDGVSHMATMIHSMLRAGQWQDRRQSNLLDGAAPFYTTYQCACGNHVAVGAIEAKFWAELLQLLGLGDMPDQMSREDWPAMKERLAAVFLGQTREHWAALFEDRDACVTPVLSLRESKDDRHLVSRGTFGPDGPAAAPRLTRTPGRAGAIATRVVSAAEVLDRWAG